MELRVSGKHTEITDSVHSYVEKKLGKIGRHFPNLTEVEVEIGTESTRSRQHRYVVQMTVNSKGTLLRGEERAPDVFAAINKVAGVMDRQIQRYKGRLYEKGKGFSPVRESIPAESGESEPGRVVRTKRFQVKSMPPEEAAEQMEFLGHNFYFFLNSTTGEFNVLYRRRDGDYGLIEPEMD